ncbi:uncharacterized protein LOC105662431 isoform X2 [Megachile rotundata]|nr:PREDICTED: DNA repair protein xrcc4-like isoform X2 [Megachile rotundata]XP_012140040.1 PREDICTED: DNA repair protein xrcc4-like isoform X2 [Megachile rotundata]XP_012140041.1 PREDICTED: DNA repair protein xrcc4-like isoform X2 [Megachile rotundata]
MNTEDVENFCDGLGKSFDEYLQETKTIFCGKDKETQFFIEDDKLEWRRNVWTLGRIKLQPVVDIKDFSGCFQQLLQFYQSIQDRISILEEENQNLKNENTDLLSKVEKITKNKTVMEQDLYKKFILILNSKKQKIRELEAAIQEKQNAAESVFDACTDEGEESDENNQELDNNSIRTKINKRKSLDNVNSESTHKTRKKDSTVNKNYTDNNATINKTSLIKGCVIGKAHSTNNSLTLDNKNILEDESSSSKIEALKPNSNFVDSDSEEDLFTS